MGIQPIYLPFTKMASMAVEYGEDLFYDRCIGCLHGAQTFVLFERIHHVNRFSM
jgi:hypothetical protein